MTRSARRGAWLPEEDSTLMSLVQSQGPNNWVRISQQIQDRSPKQCRERYHQNLKPSLKHDPITNQEGELIEQMVAEMGKRWAEIARRLGNRSDNAVKNWWNGSMNRRKRNPAHVNVGFKHVGTRLHPIPFTANREQRLYTHLQPLDTHHHFPAGSHHMRSNSWSKDQRQTTPQYQTPNSRNTSDASFTAPYTQHTRRRSSFYSPPPPAAHPQLRSCDLPRPELLPLRATTANSAYGTERRSSAFEGPLVSPALSEASQSGVFSLRCPPSLISDNQSTCSISPRTIPSPRSSISATVSHTECLPRSWREPAGLSLPLPVHQSTSIGTRHSYDRSAGGPPKQLSSTSPLSRQTTQPTACNNSPGSTLDTAKDARMHLASLLH